jgi:hypothetical protein
MKDTAQESPCPAAGMAAVNGLLPCVVFGFIDATSNTFTMKLKAKVPGIGCNASGGANQLDV